MSTVTWERETYFLGRNGTFKCRGVELLATGDDLSITPITSRGITGRCDISIPQEAIPQLIEKLKALLPADRVVAIARSGS